ncbi:MAG: small, acid-soluble spore protein, alpha/beta type [Hydrogenibacillus sp.]|nr:small, acid-soluble spore protein, alpha/beta type [Hydrogenibacillus sp.]
MPVARRKLMSERLRVELAKELGFYHKVQNGDWGEITAREAGSLVKRAIEKAEQAMATGKDKGQG